MNSFVLRVYRMCDVLFFPCTLSFLNRLLLKTNTPTISVMYVWPSKSVPRITFYEKYYKVLIKMDPKYE